MSSIAERQNSKIPRSLPDHQDSRTVYQWIAIALFGLAMTGLAVAGSFYTNNTFVEVPYVGP